MSWMQSGVDIALQNAVSGAPGEHRYAGMYHVSERP